MQQFFFSLYNLRSLRVPSRSSTIHITSSFDQLSAPTNFCVLSSFFNFPLFSFVCFRVPTSGKTNHFRCQDLTSIFLHGKTSQTQFYHPCFLITLPRPSFVHLLFPRKFDHFENASCATTQLKSHNPECGRRNKFNFTEASLC